MTTATQKSSESPLQALQRVYAETEKKISELERLDWSTKKGDRVSFESQIKILTSSKTFFDPETPSKSLTPRVSIPAQTTPDKQYNLTASKFTLFIQRADTFLGFWKTATSTNQTALNVLAENFNKEISALKQIFSAHKPAVSSPLSPNVTVRKKPQPPSVINKAQGKIEIKEEWLKEESALKVKINGRGIRYIAQTVKKSDFLFKHCSTITFEAAPDNLIKVTEVKEEGNVVRYIELKNIGVDEKWYAIFDYLPKKPSEDEAIKALSKFPNIKYAGRNRHGAVGIGTAVCYWAPPGKEAFQVDAKVSIFGKGAYAISKDGRIDFFTTSKTINEEAYEEFVLPLPPEPPSKPVEKKPPFKLVIAPNPNEKDEF